MANFEPSDGSPPLIRIAGVTKRFGAAAALEDVSLDLHEGEFLCLLGPSGCGKSTLLRVLAGFETVSSGRLELDGRDLADVPAHRRPLNMMFQSYALFPHLTVAGNIGYGLKLAGLTRAERTVRLAEMLRLTRLEGFDDRYPAQLSGGQRQRVALARALARRPRVLLLDEPLGALDRALRERTQVELKDLQRRLGTTFVTVTHDQDEAMSLADRIGVMDAGRLVQVGTPREIYDRPATRFVAGFIGAANLLDGTLLARAGTRCRVALPGGREIAGETDLDLRPGERVAAVLRPERITLAPAGQGSLESLRGAVVEATFLGASIHLRVAMEGGSELRVASGRSDAAGAGDLRPGAPVDLACAPDSVRVLR